MEKLAKNQQIDTLVYQDIIDGVVYEDIQEAAIVEITKLYAVLLGRGGIYAVPWKSILILI